MAHPIGSKFALNGTHDGVLRVYWLRGTVWRKTMLVLSPAYGRDYTSQKEVKEAWDSDKDFIIESVGPHMGRYVNKPQMNGEQVQIRYNRKQKVMIL